MKKIKGLWGLNGSIDLLLFALCAFGAAAKESGIPARNDSIDCA